MRHHTLNTVTVRDPFDPSSYTEAIVSSMLFGPQNPPRRGKVKDVYDLGDHLIIFYTDRISAFDRVFEDPIPYKGVYLCKLSLFWFRESRHVFPNHLVGPYGDRGLRVVKADRIDIEWIVRGYLYGSAWRAYSRGERVISGVRLPNGLALAEELPEPILTPTTKSDTGHDVELSKDEALARGLISKDEWLELEEASFRLYEFYRERAARAGIILADAKFEFGRVRGGLLQIDEPPTHDTSRLWLASKYSPGKFQESYCLDKEFFRAFMSRIGYRGEGPPPGIPWCLVQQVAVRARGSFEALTGRTTADSLKLRSLEEVLAEYSGG